MYQNQFCLADFLGADNDQVNFTSFELLMVVTTCECEGQKISAHVGHSIHKLSRRKVYFPGAGSVRIAV